MKPVLNCLAWYRGRPALVIERGPAGQGDKITITAAAEGRGKKTETIKVREKDIEVLHPGPLFDLTSQFNATETGTDQTLHDAWELIESGGVPVTLRELAELAYGEFTPQNAWAARLVLADGLYFTGTVDSIHAKSEADIVAGKEKRQGKAREGREREAFLERLRSGGLDPAQDGRFLQDIEALAYGKTDKSRTMKELGRTETPEEAHRLLLECRFWDKWVNPHPRRFGISPGTAAFPDLPQIDTERQDCTNLPAFAIDSPWSSDPDDALSLENKNGRRILYVHVADPASVIKGGSPADVEARARGATLYLPEGVWPMLGGAIPHFALGLTGTPNQALTFKITLACGNSPACGGLDGIEDIEIFPSLVNVTRLSYEEADLLIEGAAENTADSMKALVLRELCELAEANLERRLNAGGVHIALPEVHISAAHRTIQIMPIVPHRSAGMVRECMLLAGEGAAAWAARRRLPFPYITQETGDLPAKPLAGLAGNCQIRRCMRPRSVSARPGYHWGLGLDGYSQVTSPLRRYTDLLAHQQIHAYLDIEGGRQGPEPLTEEEVLFRLAAGDAAAQAVTQAERASKAHWTAVYLDEQLTAGTDHLWDAVVTEKRANGLGIIIPDLGLEAQTGGSVPLNETIKVRLKSVRIPECEMIFVQEK